MTWRPRSFRVGAMRERFDLVQETRDTSSGEPNVTSTTTILNNEPAALEIPSGGETLRGRQVDASVNAVFTVRYRKQTYNVQHKLRHIVEEQFGITTYHDYGIVSILPVEGGQRYMEIHCKRDGISSD